ncbi:glycosyltransferase [Candidatus Beckwithbacteria bacterium]|nr:glycosyltransferase [Candidatus Beckwithbacteria bacterium]
MKKVVLFLNENPLPKMFTTGSIAGKELRLRAALPQIDEVHVIARQGQSVVDQSNQSIGPLEKKVFIHLLPPWPYYLAALPLFFWGLYWSLKLKPISIEAESPIISGPAAVLLGKLLKKPSLVEVRASYDELPKHKLTFLPLPVKQCLLNLVLIPTLKHANIVIANSKLYKKQLAKLGIKSYELNPGLQNTPKKIQKSKHTICTIGYLGRLVPEKGVDILIEALAQLNSLNFRLEIAGLGPSQDKLKQLVKKRGLIKKVSFLGFTNNFKALASWDILINPNLVKHPLEMVNAEAAFMGVPVLCFGNQDYPETVIDGQTGLKIKNVNSKALAQALQKLIKNSKLRKRLGQQSQAFALKNYSFISQVKRLKQFYQENNII